MGEEIVYEGHRFPRGLKYCEAHTWVRLVTDKRVRVGVTDYAQKMLRAVVFIDMPKVGTRVRRGEVLATLESIKVVNDVLSPISGKVVLCNEKLDDDPGLINRDPYDEGWIVEIEVEDPDELKELLTAEEYLERVMKASLGGA